MFDVATQKLIASFNPRLTNASFYAWLDATSSDSVPPLRTTHR